MELTCTPKTVCFKKRYPKCLLTARPFFCKQINSNVSKRRFNYNRHPHQPSTVSEKYIDSFRSNIFNNNPLQSLLFFFNYLLQFTTNLIHQSQTSHHTCKLHGWCAWLHSSRITKRTTGSCHGSYVTRIIYLRITNTVTDELCGIMPIVVPSITGLIGRYPSTFQHDILETGRLQAELTQIGSTETDGLPLLKIIQEPHVFCTLTPFDQSVYDSVTVSAVSSMMAFPFIHTD
jgi:hypothetical protein